MKYKWNEINNENAANKYSKIIIEEMTESSEMRMVINSSMKMSWEEIMRNVLISIIERKKNK